MGAASLVPTNLVGLPASLVLMATDDDAITGAYLVVANAIPARGLGVVVDVPRLMGTIFDIVEVDPMRDWIKVGDGSIKLRLSFDSRPVAVVVIQANGA